MNNIHTPVMLKEAIDFLKVQKDHWYIDCNLGGAGHTKEILKRGGKVLGIDLDKDAINSVAKEFNLTVQEITDHLIGVSPNLIVIQGNFANLSNIITTVEKQSQDFNKDNIYGTLFDLGLSSNQLKDHTKGFSFMDNSPLDMRMGSEFQVKAADLLNVLSETELTELFSKLGEEPFSKRIAKTIVEYRKSKKLETTNQLVEIILNLVHKKPNQIHPATRVFQALRIAVNDELNNLKDGLPQALEVLAPGGRLVIISFHSLEDRIVKNFLKDHKSSSTNSQMSSSSSTGGSNLKILTPKPHTPTPEEIYLNPRSRSAKLRASEKV